MNEVLGEKRNSGSGENKISKIEEEKNEKETNKDLRSVEGLITAINNPEGT